jgi:UDP-N-acetylmuramyl pentapeptide phosphotransferase/UDP-N-acetylglucosamine-1-phosphate transferase
MFFCPRAYLAKSKNSLTASAIAPITTVMTWTYLFILAFSAFLCTAGGVAALLRFLEGSESLQDTPNERSNHSASVPRGAGIATTLVLAAFLLVGDAPSELCWALLGIGIISLMDDQGGVPIRYRLMVHFGAAALCLFGLTAPIFQGILPLWLDVSLSLLILVLWLNLFNFMDGIDGITGAQGIALGLGMIALALSASGIKSGFAADGAILAATCAAFLLFNWHPARIFLGDVGSIPLGLLTGFLLLNLASIGYWEAALILPAYYLADGGFTLLRRLVKGEKIWQAHSTHAYQQAVRAGLPHNKVVWWIAGANLILIALAVFSTRHEAGLPALGMAVIIAMALRWKLTTLRPIPQILAPLPSAH